MNNPHNNARTMVFSRELIVRRVCTEGVKVSEVARQLDVSRHTVYKWLARYKACGTKGLENRSSRPRRSPTRLPVEKVATIAALRRRRMTGPQIAFALSMPISSVTLELRRLGLNKLARLEPKPPVVRYEHQAPGDMIHLDIKKLGKIDGIGHRITGERTKRKRGIGWEYLHVCVDDHSRLAYSEVLPNERATSATAFLLRASDWLKRYGVKVRRVMTDNGSCYRSHLFRTAVDHVGARPIRTRPYTPRTNGKAERFIQTSIREWAYERAYETSEERTGRLGDWLEHYNQHRPTPPSNTNRLSQDWQSVNNVLENNT